MKARRVVILGVLATGLAAIAYIMRGGRRPKYAPPAAQVGLADGIVQRLDTGTPAVAELRELAAAAGRALEGR